MFATPPLRPSYKCRKTKRGKAGVHVGDALTSKRRGMEAAERKLRPQLLNNQELEEKQKDGWTQRHLRLWTAETRLKL